MKEGIYDGIPFREYLEIDAVSNSYLGKINNCPANGKLERKDTGALSFGRAVHSYVLEGAEVFNRDFAVSEKVDKRTTIGKAYYKKFLETSKGKSVVDKEEERSIKGINEAVRKHPIANKLLGQGVREQTIIWTEPTTGLPCKCRLDLKPNDNTRVLVDLKTTRSASEWSFFKSARDYGYIRQGAFYLDAFNYATGKDFDSFIFVAIEKDLPYRMGVYSLSSDLLEEGREDYLRLLNVEKECREKNNWPNYLNEGIIELGG